MALLIWMTRTLLVGAMLALVAAAAWGVGTAAGARAGEAVQIPAERKSCPHCDGHGFKYDKGKGGYQNGDIRWLCDGCRGAGAYLMIPSTKTPIIIDSPEAKALRLDLTIERVEREVAAAEKSLAALRAKLAELQATRTKPEGPKASTPTPGNLPPTDPKRETFTEPDRPRSSVILKP